MKWSKLVLLMVAIYLFSLLITFPVAYVYSWVKPKQVAAYGLKGTPWSGHADTVILSNQYRLENVDYALKWLPLLIGRLQYSLDLPVDNKSSIYGSVGMSFGGTMLLSGLQGKVPIASMAELVNSPIKDLKGQLILDNVSVQKSAKGFEAASGEVHWKKANFAALNMELGDFSAKLQYEKGSIKAVVTSSTSSPVELDGTLTLGAKGDYRFEGKIAGRNPKINGLLTQTRFRKGRDGKLVINERGRIPLNL